MSLYKYVSATTLEYILNGSIRFTQPGGFNDPFELALEVYNPTLNEDEKVNIQFDVLSQDDLINKYLLDKDFQDDNCSDVFSRELISNLNKEIGILCLSKNSDSHLMWAHYADEYSGAVIEFDENHEYFSGLTEVKYEKDRPIIHMNYFLENKTIPISNLCIKPDIWSYEKEFRITRSLRDCKKNKAKTKKFDIYTNEIPLDAIKTVTLGERCSLESARNTYHKLKNTHVALSIAALANWKYEFRYEPIKFNEPIKNMSPMISPRTAEIFAEDKSSLGEVARYILQKHPMSKITKWRL
ncbi:hypothetical protein AB93_0241 [Escherichia coli 5-172-05_S3_C1]|uniref:DUF2971 domain-containing protein n=1 Tax=Escherichia coli TaxID=562 RepID=UPI0004DACB85|nr:DUF2971 domain-containing protein [Escherichia coli]KEL56395.1 hypothetical protein AB93_0241 [Escherichia coli 5-172-05_S3_C1]